MEFYFTNILHSPHCKPCIQQLILLRQESRSPRLIGERNKWCMWKKKNVHRQINSFKYSGRTEMLTLAQSGVRLNSVWKYYKYGPCWIIRKKKDIWVIISNVPHLKKIIHRKRHRKFWRLNQMFCMFLNISQNTINLQDVLPSHFWFS